VPNSELHFEHENKPLVYNSAQGMQTTIYTYVHSNSSNSTPFRQKIRNG